MAEGMNPNERTNVVAKILQVLHQTSGSAEDPRRLEALAAEFERRTFESARSRQEYLQKIAIKLAKLKQKAEEEQRTATQTTNVADPYIDGARNSMQHMRSYSNSPANADQMAQPNYTVLSQADALYRQPPLQTSTAGQNNQGIRQSYTAQHSRQTHQPNQSYKANAEQEMDDFAYMAKMFLDTDAGAGATGQGEKDQYGNFSGQMNASYQMEPWVNSGGGGDQYTIVPEISGPSCLQSGGGGMQMGQQSSYPPIVGQATGPQGSDLHYPGQYQRQNSGSGPQQGMLLQQSGMHELRGEAMGSVVGASSDGKGHSAYEGSGNTSASYMKSIMALKHNIQLVWQKLQTVKNDADKYRLQQILQNLIHQKSQLEGKQSMSRQPAAGQGPGMPLSSNTVGSNQPVVAQFTGVPTTENSNWVNNANELQRRYWALVYHLRDRYLVDLQDLRHKMSEKCSAHKLDPKTYERARKFIDCADAIIPLLSSSSDDPRFAAKGRTQQEFDQVNAIMKWLNSYQPLHAWQSQRAQFRQHWQSQAQMPTQSQTQLQTPALRTPATGPQPVVGKANAPKASQSSKPAAKKSRKADSVSQQAGTMDDKSTEKPKKKPATTSSKAKASQAAKKNASAISKSKAPTAQNVKPPPAPTFATAEAKTPAEVALPVDDCKDLSEQVEKAEKVALHYQAKMMGMAETASKEISSNIRSAFGENARMQVGPSSNGEAIHQSHYIAANGLSNVSMHLYPPSADCLRVSEQFLDSMESTKLNVSEVDGVHNGAVVDGVEATGDSAQTSANQENLSKKFDVADVARTEEGVDDGLGRKVYEGEHMTIIRSGDGNLVPLFESEKEPFKGYTAAKKMFGSEISGQRGLSVQDMMDTSSSDDEQTRARFASVVVESDSIRARAIAVPSKPSRDTAADVDAFVADPFQLKVAQMLEHKLDRWYEEAQPPACHGTSSKDGWDGSTWSSDTGVRLFSKVKPGTAFTTPSHAHEAPSSEDVRILAASPRREVEEQVGQGRRKLAANRNSDSSSSSSSSEDEAEVGFREMLRSVAVDSDYVRSTAEKSAMKAHQTYREEQDRAARTDELESSHSRPSLRQVATAVAGTPTPTAAHHMDGTASVLDDDAQASQRRKRDRTDVSKTKPSRHKDPKRIRRR